MSVSSNDVLRPHLPRFGDVRTPMDSADVEGLPDDDELVDDADEYGSFEDETPEDAPLIDLDSLSPEERQFLEGHYRGLYESEFQKDKGALQSLYDTRQSELESQNDQLLEANAQLQAYVAGMQRFTLDLAKRYKVEAEFYEFDNSTKQTLTTAAQSNRSTKREAREWFDREVAAVDSHIEAVSLSNQGVKLFDVAGDKELQQAKQSYLAAASALSRSQFKDQRAQAQYQAATARLEQMLQERRESGIALASSKGRRQSRTNQSQQRNARQGNPSGRGIGGAASGGSSRGASSVERGMDQARQVFQRKYGRPPTNADYSEVYDIFSTLGD